jgi:hypothetical protein
MMRKRLISSFFSLALFFLEASLLFALGVNTHETINNLVAQKSFNEFSLNSYLINNLGFTEGIEKQLRSIETMKVWEWISVGGKYEDEPPYSFPYLRSANHFHNPLTDDGYSGVWGTGILSGSSSVKWSQLPIATQNPGGSYSWHDVRDYFYMALAAQTDAARQKNYADLFRGLGQLMHLVQDLSVPEHARNDGHYVPGFEEWVARKDESGNMNVDISTLNPVFFDQTELRKPNPLGAVPVANLFDVGRYTSLDLNPAVALIPNIGISEYANANFLSPDTMFTSDFPYPRLGDCLLYHDDSVDRKYLKIDANATGEKVTHLALVSWLYFWRMTYFPQNLMYLPVGLDASCYRDYASFLLPRAVGYSVGLLKYFFRGRIDMVQDTEAGFGYRIVNHSEDEMEGRFDLYYDTTNDMRMMIFSENLSLGGVNSGNNKSRNIVFPDPTDAKVPGNYVLVFRGRQGNEVGAVVGKVLELRSLYLRITCNGLTPSRSKTIKLVDANGGVQIKTSDPQEPGKIGPFFNVSFPATVYLYHRDTPSESSQALFTFWTRCETGDPGVNHPSVIKGSCPIAANSSVSFSMATGMGGFNVKEIKWKRGATLTSFPDEVTIFDFSGVKVMEKVMVHYQTWYPTLAHGCNPEPEIKVINKISYPSSVEGTYPSDCNGPFYGDVCRTGLCGTSPYGTCLFWDYTRTIGNYNGSEENLVILTDDDGNNPVFEGLDICVDARVESLGIGCCDGGGGPDAYLRENFIVPCWEKYTFRMVDSNP